MNAAKNFPGHVKEGVYCKTIEPRNTLRVPVPSFTIDKAEYDARRTDFDLIQITVPDHEHGVNAVWEISAADFDAKRKEYDYGRGPGYYVPICEFEKIAPKHFIEDLTGADAAGQEGEEDG